MSVTSVGSISSTMLQSILDMRSQLDDLQRQLGTGKKSDTYAGLGLDRGLTVSLNAQLSALTGFGDTINTVNTRISLSSTALSQMAGLGSDVQKAIANTSAFDPDNSGVTTAQKSALSDLGSFLGLLNTQAGDRYLFSGAATNQPAVDTMDHILNGNGAQAGLKQIISERHDADLGADGLGRLAITQPTGTSVKLAEETPPTVFGLKLAGVSSTLTGATVTGPSGSPASATVDLGVNPAAGDSIRYQFTLPDGSSANITLTATTDNPPGANQFTIGATPTLTAGNLNTALNSALTTLSATSLSAASAVAASDNFFNTDATHPPQRVNGSPFTATSLVDGTPADTVAWYTGDDATDSARGTAVARVDPSITVSYGTRANEQGIRWVLQNMATLAAVSYSNSDPNAAAMSAALNQRLNTNLAVPAGTQKISNIEADLAAAQSSMKSATDRQQQTNSTLSNMLQQIENVPQEEVGAQLLALQTSLQASLQTTALLSKLSLVNYLPS